MRILVTGGAGYIGSVTVLQLLEAGHEVVVFDNLRTGHRQAVPKGARLVEGDLGDQALLDRALKDGRLDAVMHFAAASLVGESMTNPLKYFREDVSHGINLLEAMGRAGVGAIVFSSSAATYGEPEQMPITEEFPTVPTNPYGEAKLMFEKVLEWCRRTRGLHYVALRYFNVAGAYGGLGEDHDPETHLVPLIFHAALGRRPELQVFGDDYDTPDGTCIRDYIHVADIARAHVLALKATRSQVYNLGNQHGFSVKEVLATAEKVMGRKVPSRVVGRRAGDPARLVAAHDKIRRDLGWTPKFADLDEIVRSAWEWHQAHPDGYAGRE